MAATGLEPQLHFAVKVGLWLRLVIMSAFDRSPNIYYLLR